MPPANRHEPKRAKSSHSDYSVTEFLAEFPDDAACLEHLWRSRFSPDGEHAECPVRNKSACSSATSSSTGGRLGPAPACGHHVHPMTGTIFEKSSTSLNLWFHAMYLMTSTRCGISAKQLERELGVPYKTARRMLKRIRTELMADDVRRPAAVRRRRDRRDIVGWESSSAVPPRAEVATLPRGENDVLAMVEREGRVMPRVIAPAGARGLVMPFERT